MLRHSPALPAGVASPLLRRRHFAAAADAAQRASEAALPVFCHAAPPPPCFRLFSMLLPPFISPFPCLMPCLIAARMPPESVSARRPTDLRPRQADAPGCAARRTSAIDTPREAPAAAAPCHARRLRQPLIFMPLLPRPPPLPGATPPAPPAPSTNMDVPARTTRPTNRPSTMPDLAIRAASAAFLPLRLYYFSGSDAMPFAFVACWRRCQQRRDEDAAALSSLKRLCLFLRAFRYAADYARRKVQPCFHFDIAYDISSLFHFLCFFAPQRLMPAMIFSFRFS